MVPGKQFNICPDKRTQILFEEVLAVISRGIFPESR